MEIGVEYHVDGPVTWYMTRLGQWGKREGVGDGWAGCLAKGLIEGRVGALQVEGIFAMPEWMARRETALATSCRAAR